MSALDDIVNSLEKQRLSRRKISKQKMDAKRREEEKRKTLEHQARVKQSEKLKGKAPKVQAPPEPVFVNNEDEEGDQIVRSPRIIRDKRSESTQLAHAKHVEETGSLLTAVLGVTAGTRERRQAVVDWMVNGHTHNGRMVTLDELAVCLNVDTTTVEEDHDHVREKMAAFYTDNSKRDAPAMAHMLMEMKIQDRGRALTLFNLIQADIKQADSDALEITDPTTGRTKTIGRLAGRDRAAMYSASLAALELANRATNGVDQLFKLTGAAQRVQQIIHAKSVQVNQGNGTMLSMSSLQEFVANSPEIKSVLPSVRKRLNLPAPPVVELTQDDKDILSIGEQERWKEQQNAKRQSQLVDDIPMLVEDEDE